MTLDVPKSLTIVDRTPSIAHLMQGVAGGSGAAASGGTGVAGGRSFAQLLNSQHKQAAVAAGAETIRASTGAASSSAAAAKKAAAKSLEPAAFQVNHQQNEDPAATRHAEVEKAAEGLVSNALILPILKQVRRSMESENSVFSGGNGEKTFGPEFDMQLADRIAKSPRLGVKNALVQRMEKRNALQPKTTTKTSTLDVHG